MKRLYEKNDEIFTGCERIPLGFFFKQVLVALLISGNFLIFAQFSNSQIVFTLALLMVTQLIHYLLIFNTKPISKYSLYQLSKVGQLFSSSIFSVLLSWSIFNSLRTIYKEDSTNEAIVIVAGCELLLLSILKRKINRPELDLKFANLEIISSLFCLFCGILLNIYDGLSVIDCYFNLTLSSLLLINSLYRVAIGVANITNSTSEIEEDIDEVLTKVMKI